MLYSTEEGVLINLNYIGAVYKRKTKNADTFDVLAIPYDRINSLADLQPHETNPKYEPRESFEIFLRRGLLEKDATRELLALAGFVNNNNQIIR